ncbi:hypothetical protein C2E23DRAFT_816686 [Lenzites betulinus]|nr:hypothetical protein C2E23DRAFT_816686 [Lenzites betulinus]
MASGEWRRGGTWERAHMARAAEASSTGALVEDRSAPPTNPPRLATSERAHIHNPVQGARDWIYHIQRGFEEGGRFSRLETRAWEECGMGGPDNLLRRGRAGEPPPARGYRTPGRCPPPRRVVWSSAVSCPARPCARLRVSDSPKQAPGARHVRRHICLSSPKSQRMRIFKSTQRPGCNCAIGVCTAIPQKRSVRTHRPAVRGGAG